MAGRLEGKVAIVTGAGSAGPGLGNGKATALRFAQEGAQVLAVDRSTEAVAETAQLILAEGGECIAHTADVTDEAQVAAFVERCVTTWGQVDVLHNNVGILAPGGPEEVTDADWERVMKVNVTAVLYCCRHVLPHMAARRAGSVINVSSIGSRRMLGVNYVAYPTSKAALNGFTRAVAVQYGPAGIRCNALLPGIIRTPMLEQQVMNALGAPDDPVAFAAYCAQREAVIPMHRLGDSWDVANAALFLASDDSKYVTGIELVVDGGLSQTVGFGPYGEAARPFSLAPMCRNITTLRGLEPPPTAEEIEAAARQYVRKVSGVQKSSPATAEAIEEAVRDVAAVTTALLARLPERRNPPPTVPPLRRPEVARRLAAVNAGAGHRH